MQFRSLKILILIIILVILPISAVASITDLNIAGNFASTRASWDDTDFATVRTYTIMRSSTATPNTLSEGSLVSTMNHNTSPSVFSDALLPDGTYYYSIFPMALDGTPGPPTSFKKVIKIPPPSLLGIMTVNPVTGAASLYTSLKELFGPDNRYIDKTDYYKHVILRKSETSPPRNLNEGTPVAEATGRDFPIMIEDTTITHNGRIYYSVFAQNKFNDLSDPVSLTVTITILSPPPTNLQVTTTNTSITLQWTNAGDPYQHRTRIQRTDSRNNSTTRYDGTLVSSYSDTVSPGAYHYKIYNISDGTTSSLPLEVTINIPTVPESLNRNAALVVKSSFSIATASAVAFITVNRDGDVYVPIYSQNCVQKWDKNGQFISTLPKPTDTSTPNYQPLLASIAPNQSTYVATLTGNKLYQFNAQDQWVQTLTFTAEKGFPADIAIQGVVVTTANRLKILDSKNRIMFTTDLEGNILSQSPLAHTSPTSRLSLLLTDEAQNLYTLDTQSIKRYSPTLTFIDEYTPTNNTLLMIPAFIKDNLLYYTQVANPGNLLIAQNRLYKQNLTTHALESLELPFSAFQVVRNGSHLWARSNDKTIRSLTPAKPMALTASANPHAKAPNFVWRNSPTGNPNITIVRSSTHAPQSLTDGTIVTENQTGITQKDANLPDGRYYYSIFNTQDGLESEPATVIVDVVGNAPAKPQNLSKALDQSRTPRGLTLSWQNPADPDFAYVSLYRRRSSTTSAFSPHDTEPTLVSQNIQTHSYEDRNLPDGDYSYTLYATDSYGNTTTEPTSFSGSVQDNPPSTPTLFRASAAGNRITLSWTPVSNNGFTGVTIRRDTLGYPASISSGDLVTSNSQATSLTEARLPNGTYYYSIFAIDAQQNSSDKATANAQINENFLMADRPLNYPNPFKMGNGTIIGYWLNQNVDTELRIYTITGSQVYRATYTSGVDQGARAGYNRIVLNAGLFGFKWPSGVYSYLIIANNQIIGKGKLAILPE